VTGRRSAIDGRTTQHPGYAVSQQKRKRIGATIETITADRETNVVAFRKTLEPVRTMVGAQPYFRGELPAYADYAVFGCFQWARCISPFPLLTKDDPVWAWHDRFFSAFDGFARKALGYPLQCIGLSAIPL
jgi:glutathione S-transferase